MSKTQLATTLAAAGLLFGVLAGPVDGSDAAVDRGRYLVQIAGCNDCHTDGYMARNGEVPEAQWLTGSALGWNGPWGTTYASNLRLWMQGFSQAEWLQYARSVQSRPPMPWFGLREMSDADLVGIYAYIRKLGPAGQPAPAYLPPGEPPSPPFAVFPGPPPQSIRQ